MSAITRPALRYYGGKWRIARWIISHFPPHVAYCEPFAGAASVLLHKAPSVLEVYNDSDHVVVTFFRVLRERTEELIRAIQLTPYARAEVKHAYQACDDEVEAARRFYVRAWQSRGGPRAQWGTGWRYQRQDNRGKRVIGDWNDTDHLWRIVARLKQVQLECGPADEVIQRFDSPDTLYYCDPPYLAETRSESWSRRGYAQEMTDDDHRRLAGVLHQARGMVLLSGYRSSLYADLYRDWPVVTRETQTDNPAAGMRTECLWLSPAAAARGRQLGLPLNWKRQRP